MKIKTDKFILADDGKLTINMSVEGTNDITQTSVVVDTNSTSFFVGKVATELTDLIYLSAIVYGIDRTFNRNKFSIDGWAREFDVTVKVESFPHFLPLEKDWNTMLTFLTGDFWSIHFIQQDAQFKYSSIELPELDDKIEQVNLFSGGMDSLIGAIDFMSQEHESKLCLVSHLDHNMGGPKVDQERLLEMFEQKYKGKYYRFPIVRISPQITGGETTCRSRSLMFLSIALLVAAYKNIGIVVPENGSVSLNFPLTKSRRAACSTRTTHPLFIYQLIKILDSLDIHIPIRNPYEFKTKGMMVHECTDRDYLINILNKSNSCGKRNQKQFFYDHHDASHCGRCMPCMYRKASLLGFQDSTIYGLELKNIYNYHTTLSDDFYALLSYLRKELTDNYIRKELRIAGLGKLSHFEDYVTLVQNTRKELKNLIIAEGSLEEKRHIGLV